MFAELTCLQARTGLTPLLEKVAVAPFDSAIEVIYVQPEVTGGDRCIDIGTFASHVARHDDPVSQRFAATLEKWRRPAGSSVPA